MIRHLLPFSLLAACGLLGCALFAPKQMPMITGLSIQQVSGPGGGPAGAGELVCRADRMDYKLEDLSMQVQFHDCGENPVEVEDGRQFLKSPQIINQAQRPDDQFTPKVQMLVHSFAIGEGRIDPRACVTFRCTAKVPESSGSETIESRMCRGSVIQQRICSAGSKSR